MSETSEEILNLFIRCAIQSFEDLPLSCPANWSVAELKRKLYELCPSKPDPKRQRLIYAGHCLHDEHTLKAIFDRRAIGDSNVHIIHLVCPPKDAAELSGIRRRNVTTRTESRNESPSLASNTFVNANPSIPSNMFQSHFNPMLIGNAGTNNIAGMVNMQSNIQLSNMHQEYMMHYFNYMNQMMTALGNNPQGNLYSSVINNVQQQSRMTEAMQQRQQDINQVFGPVPDNPAPAARAAGGIMQEAVVGDLDLPPRDFLDVIYKAIRICFLIMIVYIYSSAERFFGVLLFIVLVWFVQARRDRNNRQRVDRELAAAVNNVRQQNQESENDAIANQGVVDDGSNEPSAWVVFWSTCYTFISSFFSSLIPENPVPVNVN